MFHIVLFCKLLTQRKQASSSSGTYLSSTPDKRTTPSASWNTRSEETVREDDQAAWSRLEQQVCIIIFRFSIVCDVAIR